LLGQEPDFIVLTESAQEVLRVQKAPVAALIMAGVVLAVVLGWMPVAVAAVLGVILMVLSASLTMEEAYRFIDWKAVFVIAGMLPLGLALQRSGAAELLAGAMVATVGDYGPLALVAGVYILTVLVTQAMPSAAVVVLMAPIALNAADSLGLSPYALLMTVALAAAASFLSPVAHPANVLIMGAGGYRYRDYLKVGVPLTLVMLLVILLVLPMVWPLHL
jgi:di/tricarboxylate transporter